MLEAVVGRHSHARKRPAAEIAERGFGALALHFVERSSAGVGGGDQRAHAGPADHINGDLVLFHGAQHADVRDAARKSASEREPDFRTATFLRVGKRAQAVNGSLQPICCRLPRDPFVLETLYRTSPLAGLSG